MVGVGSMQVLRIYPAWENIATAMNTGAHTYILTVVDSRGLTVN